MAPNRLCAIPHCILRLMRPIHIFGGGLAGCEAAWQIARAGYDCLLFEMRPERPTPAHKTDRLAELVCSNSLKSESENTAPWLLKEELRRLDSLLLGVAQKARVPGGHALTVDREVFAQEVSRAIEENPRIELRREEGISIPGDAIAIIATGPLTSGAMAEEIGRLTGAERLFFYDSISPIVEADSIDLSIAFRQRLFRHTSRKTTRASLKPACLSKSWRGAAARRCASVP
jgi:methylenetetrahydrofolate--tRNA-(uracil-5-)-methyltransferase